MIKVVLQVIPTYDMSVYLLAKLTMKELQRMRLQVLLLPLLDEFEEDKRIWKFSTDGLYSVKSTYRLVMDRLETRDQFTRFTSHLWTTFLYLFWMY
ncbi:hypothetical protein AAZX31_17G247800 [Glycine max]